MGILNVQASNQADGTVRGMTVNPANIQIQCNGSVIGMVQSINPNESINVQKIQALGFEGVVTSAKGNYSGGTFSTPVIQIYDTTPLEAFGITDQGGGVGGMRQLPRLKNLAQQRQPVDIVSITFTPNTGEEIVERYVNCWITNYGKTVNTSGASITVNVSWTYEKCI